MRLLTRIILLAAWVSFVSLAKADGYAPSGYKTGFATIQMLGADIYRSLDPSEKAIISSQPISFDTSAKPSVHLFLTTEGSSAVRGVYVSAGFIELVNQVAHAKAIDKVRRGYFSRYIDLVEKADGTIPPLPDRGNARFWTEDVLNEQFSNFNSIVGIVVATSVAEHCLGFYDQYRSASSSEEGAQINNYLTREEWERAYREGLENALNAGCMIEGFVPFFQAIDKMKPRPAWAACFLPDSVRFGSMRRQLVKLQKNFLKD
jgi:hypothetical protein